MPRDRMHQSCAGGGTKHGTDDESFGETRVFERGPHDSGFTSHGLGVGGFAIDALAIHDLAIGDFAIHFL